MEPIATTSTKWIVNSYVYYAEARTDFYQIFFIEYIKVSTSFQFFPLSNKLRVVRAIDDGIGFDTNIVPVHEVETATNTYTNTNVDFFYTDNEHIPVHVLIPSKNASMLLRQ